MTVRVATLPRVPARPVRGPFVRGALALSLLIVGSGCGYAFVGAARSGETPQDGAEPRRIAIRTLENRTMEPGAEMVVTEALRTEFLGRSDYRLVTDPDTADWVLDGRVGSIQVQTKTFSTVVLALEQTLTMKVDLEIRDREGRPLGLSGNTLAGSEVFLASADVEVSRKNRREALRRVASMIADRVGAVLDLEGGP